MTDPKRLFETEDDPMLSTALRSSSEDEAPKGAEERMLAGLGLPPIGAAGGATKAIAGSKTIAKLGLVKWLGASAVVAAVATGGMLATREPIPPAPAPTPAPIPTPSVVESAVVVVPPPVESAVTPPAPSVAVRAAAPRAVPSTVPSSAPSSASSLSEELALLAEANAAVRRGDAAAATNALDRYDARFGQGSLSVEAEALRIEVVALTDEPRARGMARTFIEKHPTSPVAHRMRRIAEGPK